MDQERFDRIARRLGGTVSRRAGIAGVVSALTGGIVGRTLASPRKQRAKPEGPCGDRSRKDNACKKDSQCCTGFCDRTIRNEDGLGRCRCIRRGNPCSAKAICCKHLVCAPDGTCQAAVKTGKSCAAGNVCAAANASCSSYYSGTPAGTRCLLANGAACEANGDCRSNDCVANVCAAETCTVCVSGCPSSSIADAITAAVDGDVITIDGGTWESEVAVDRNLEFRPCNGGAVRLVPTGSGFGGPSARAGEPKAPSRYMMRIDGSAPHSLVLRDLEFDGVNTAPFAGLLANGPQGQPIDVKVLGCLFHNLTGHTISAVLDGAILIQDTVIRDGQASGVSAMARTQNDPTKALVTLDRSTVTGMTTANSAAVTASQVTLIVRDTVISGNVSSAPGGFGGGVLIADGELTLAGSTRIEGNTAGYGGGLSFYRSVTTLGPAVIEPTVRISGNTATEGSGVERTLYNGGTGAITGANLTTITGNTGGDQCDDFDGVSVYTTVANCLFT